MGWEGEGGLRGLWGLWRGPTACRCAPLANSHSQMTKIQNVPVQVPDTSAGPSARAGLMLHPSRGSRLRGERIRCVCVLPSVHVFEPRFPAPPSDSHGVAHSHRQPDGQRGLGSRHALLVASSLQHHAGGGAALEVSQAIATLVHVFGCLLLPPPMCLPSQDSTRPPTRPPTPMQTLA